MLRIEKNEVLSNLKTKSPLLFFAGGILFIMLGTSEIISTKKSQDVALTHAKHQLQQPYRELNDSFMNSIEVTNTTIDTGHIIGILSLPSLQAELPIVEGIDEDSLDVGVGHYPGTALPAQKDQIVLSGHRDTVFRRLGDLKIGEEIVLQLEGGQYSYKVTKTKIVHKDDRTIIVPTYPTEELILITCYPFHMVGNAPERYIVYATPTYTMGE